MKERPDLDAVLEELYALDPALRAQAPSIRKLAEELLAAKPDASIDEAFVTRLRLELKARVASKPAGNPFVTFFTMPTNKYLVPGLAILAVAAVGALTLSSLQRPAGAPSSEIRGAAEPKVAHLGENAFGTLSTQSTGRPEGGGGGGTAMGLGAAPATTPSALPPMAGGDSAKMIAPGDYVPTVYTYAYVGDPIDGLLSPNVDVMKVVPPGVTATAEAAATLSRLGLGAADLTKLQSAKVQSFSLSEDREMGYAVWVDVASGFVSFSQNQRWPITYPEWDAATGQVKDPIRKEEIPADEDSIRIADAFLSEYGIDRRRYGTPFVRDFWRIQYELAADKSQVYLPDAVSVVYPEIVDGKELREMNGDPTGMEVSINVRLKRVTGAYNISVRDFAVSSYEGETDAARILDIASKGGPFAWYPDRGEYTKVEVKIGTPTIGYVRSFQEGGELFVPALLFPIQDPPPELVWQKYVVTPLPKGMLAPPMWADGPGKPILLTAPEAR